MPLTAPKNCNRASRRRKGTKGCDWSADMNPDVNPDADDGVIVALRRQPQPSLKWEAAPYLMATSTELIEGQSRQIATDKATQYRPPPHPPLPPLPHPQPIPPLCLQNSSTKPMTSLIAPLLFSVCPFKSLPDRG